MPPVFADTSGFLAFLSPDDEHHVEALQLFSIVAARRSPLLTTSYVTLETYALVGHRLGLGYVRQFRARFVPVLDVTWVRADLHERGLDDWLRFGSRDLSLVDTVSFAFMEERGLREALAFDRHFTDRGFMRPQ
jgi:predicted nucleic acid-binding protein